MNWIKKIIARIFALWALLVFASTMFIFLWFYLLCAILPEPYSTHWHRRVSQIWMSIFIYGSFCSFKVRNKNNYNTPENAVVVCNHNSLIDIPVSFPFLPRANKTIAKKSFVYVPLFGWIYKWGSVIVDRKNDQSRKQSFDEMKKVLTTGLDMLIFPEGTRNKTNEPLKSFYDGAFKLSVDTGKPIIPVVLLNTRYILPATPSLYLRPGKIYMDILPAIYPQGHTVQTLKEEVKKIMGDYYLANNPKHLD
jgi:1-acyl-sn-glycerol-3-phosphate acyltransferase